ncbi:hypothetical protein PEC311524_43730 [Pectobacterium carotovorum subsp. carotovorum]|nr:hypothetical protein PEC311524_43730 [Pectobacterium carotovorum subsp. carotovorum]
MNNIDEILKKILYKNNTGNIDPESIKSVGEEKTLSLIKHLIRDKERKFTKKESIQNLEELAIFFQKLSFHLTYDYLNYLSNLVKYEFEIKEKILNYLSTSPFGKKDNKYTPMDSLYIFNNLLFEQKNKLIKGKIINKKEFISMIYQNKGKEKTNYDIVIQHISSCLCASLKFFYGDQKSKVIFINEDTLIDNNSLTYNDEISTDFEEYITHNNTWLVSDFYFRRLFYFGDDCLNLITKTHQKIPFKHPIYNSKLFLNMDIYHIPCPKNEYLHYDVIHNYNFKKNKRNYTNQDIYINIKDQIKDILFIDIDNNSNLFNGLTLKEWCLGYIVALAVSQEHTNNNLIKIDKKNLAQKLCRLGINSLEKSDQIINGLSFSLRSKDLFDTPFIQSGTGFIYMLKNITELLDPINALISNLGSMNIDLSIKGEGFENFIRESLNKKGLNCSQYHTKIKTNDKTLEYEYDALFCQDNTLFILECKNTFVSFSDMTKAYRIKNLIDNSVKQISRLRDGACILKDDIEKKFNKPFDQNKIITIVVNCLPINYKKIDNTYIISKDSLLAVLSKFKKNKFNTVEFIKELEKDSNQEKTISKIKNINHLFVLNQESGITSVSMDIE